MTTEERIDKVGKILSKTRPSGNNLLVLAHMTDKEIEETYNELFDIK